MNKTTQEWKEYFNTHKETLTFKDYFEKEKTISFAFIPDPEVSVMDYPYAYKRSQMIFSIEHNKKGSRLIMQSRNPKTLILNKPKKSTYNDISVLIVDGNGHIKTLSLCFNDDITKIKAFYNRFKDVLSREQLLIYAKIVGYTKTMEHVEFSFSTQHFKHKLTGEIVTAVNMLRMNEYVKCDANGNIINEEAEKEKEKQTRKQINQTMQTLATKEFLRVSK